MANLIESVEQLKDWKAYREFLKVELKKLEGEEQAWISKKKIEFQIEGKPYKGYAFLAGKKGKIAYQKCKAKGVQFYEGVCTLEGKTLQLSGFKDNKFIKEAVKTFLKLKLGWKVAAPGGEGAAAGEDAGASAGEQAALKRLKSGMSAEIKQAVDGGGAQGKAILDKVKQAAAMEKSSDFAGATAVFEEIQSLLEQGGGTLTPERRQEMVTDLSEMEKNIDKLMAVLK